MHTYIHTDFGSDFHIGSHLKHVLFILVCMSVKVFFEHWLMCNWGFIRGIPVLTQ